MITSAFQDDLHCIQAISPLIHNVTNLVVMQQTANVLLALGASPIMAHAQQELEDLLQIVHALVLNIGTLDSQWIDSMSRALAIAKSRQLPVILDPVGAGASHYRTQSALQLLQQGGITVVRGNASEIMALCDTQQKSHGVDSARLSDEAIQAAQQLSQQYHVCVVISGVCDYIVSSLNVDACHGGSAMMTRVTGMGCSATAVIAAFLAVNANPHHAALHGMTLMNEAGALAAKTAAGPGSLQWHFSDVIYQIIKQSVTGAV